MTSQNSSLTAISLTGCGAGATKIIRNKSDGLVKSPSIPHGGRVEVEPFEIMSLAYPVKQIEVNAVMGLEVHEVHVGSVWKTGNLLFRAPEPGSRLRTKMKKWAKGVDAHGRGYILWKADNPRANRLVIQQLNSHYCFEVSPA